MELPEASDLELNIAPLDQPHAEKRPGVLARAYFRSVGTAERRRLGAMFNSRSAAELNFNTSNLSFRDRH